MYLYYSLHVRLNLVYTCAVFTYLITRLSSISIAPRLRSPANTGGILSRISVLTWKKAESNCPWFNDLSVCSARADFDGFVDFFDFETA